MTFSIRSIALVAVAAMTVAVAGGCDEDISYRGGLHTGYGSDELYFGGWDDDDDLDQGRVIIQQRTPVIRHHERVIVAPPVTHRRVIVPPVVGHRRYHPPVRRPHRVHPRRKDSARYGDVRHYRRRPVKHRRRYVHPRRPGGYPPNIVHPGQSPWSQRRRLKQCD